MFQIIDKILAEFRKCFSRKAAFEWFVIIVVGLVVRSDHLGVTSFIRELGLRPELYESLIHFFRATSWELGQVRQAWYEAVKERAPLFREDGRTILIGDGVKQAKEARRMPAVKKLFQESENSSKPEYIFGHMFGGLGILIGNSMKKFCLPLSIRLHDGLQFLNWWNSREEEPDESIKTHIVKMVEDGFQAARTFGKSILLLDRYFLSVPALKRLAELNASGAGEMEIVTKAKQNCVAYRRPVEKKGRGRPAKKGEKVVLRELFTKAASSFVKARLNLYGDETEVEYLCIDLLWGAKLYQKLRFILVKYKGAQSILVSTDLTLPAETIIRLYSYRFKIETCFRELKQQVGAFGYHFWTKAMPKLSHFRKKKTPDPLNEINDEKMRSAIRSTVRAVEGYVMFACIAIGLVQIAALRFSGTNELQNGRYLRTRSNSVASEGTTMCVLRRNIFRFVALQPNCTISQIIRAKSDMSAALHAA